MTRAYDPSPPDATYEHARYLAHRCGRCGREISPARRYCPGHEPYAVASAPSRWEREEQ